jgi:hypothetical protein
MTEVRGCSSSFVRSASDCVTGDICAPAPGGSFGSSLCIEQAGDVACPATGYTTRTVYFESNSDTRGCSTCVCTPSGQGCLNPSVTEYSTADGTCGIASTIFPAPFSCDPVGVAHDVRYEVTATPGMCTPNAVTATGSATAVKPHTVCCL